jgi:hypothetical protein
MAYTESALGVRKGETTMQVCMGMRQRQRREQRQGAAAAATRGSGSSGMHLGSQATPLLCCGRLHLQCANLAASPSLLLWPADWHGRRHEGRAEHLEGAARH